MPETTSPTTDREVTMSQFSATVSASNAEDAIERVQKHLNKVEGFALTGRVSVRSQKHLLFEVEVANQGGDVNDCWVVLTSYGITPAEGLGSVWQTVPGVGCFA